MKCKRCGSDDVARSRRRSLWDHFKAALGRWPYRCDDCGLRFAAPFRYPEDAAHLAEAALKTTAQDVSGADFRAYASDAERQGPDMVFRTQAGKPQAKIVLQADTHEQLNQILLTLNRAVNAYQTRSRTHASQAETASAAR